jgi:serine/threonine protein phosphatase PrpC
MTETQTEYTWGAFGETTRGTAHDRNGLPNQDALDWFPKQPWKFGPPLVMAVSDGHGSSKSFRSDTGSCIAVCQTRKIIRHLLDSETISSDLSVVKKLLEERLPRDLVSSWADEVEKHRRENPFTPEELAFLTEKEGPLACEKVLASPLIAYGATLLTVFVSSTFIHILQLGDGDILTVSDAGEVNRPLPKDERLIANETTSLCQRSAWQDFRSCFIPLAGSPPALILLSSDGYSNSFRDEDSFLKVGKDILDLIRTEGPRAIRISPREWLREASQAGSGDDITLGIIYRKDAIQPENDVLLSTEEIAAENNLCNAAEETCELD